MLNGEELLHGIGGLLPEELFFFHLLSQQVLRSQHLFDVFFVDIVARASVSKLFRMT
jgi:hypothetical protein